MIDWAGMHNTKYKAFDCLLNWLNYYEDKDKNKAEPIDYLEMRFILGGERELYDFFDENKIYCYPDPCGCHTPPLWGYCIMQPETEVVFSGVDPKSRIEMERDLFLAAFKIIEKTL